MWTPGWWAAPSPSPPPSPLLPVKGDGLIPGSLDTAGFGERQEKGAMDMQGHLAAREGPRPGPWEAGSGALGAGVREDVH